MSSNKGVCLAAMLAVSGMASAPIQASEDWEFAFSPLFLWGVSLDGNATINDVGAPLELDFTDEILENMEAVFTAHFEARKGNLGFFMEYQYIDLEPGIDANTGPIDASVDVSFEETFFEGGVSWRFPVSDRTVWEILGGARYTDQDLDADVVISGPVGANPRTKLEGGDDWWQAIGGVRVNYRISDRWNFIARTDYGYGDSDNTSFNVQAQFNYRFNDWGSVFIGARYLEYDYEEENGNVTEYAFDAAKQGPLAGLTIHW
jgi:hypothetical protein